MTTLPTIALVSCLALAFHTCLAEAPGDWLACDRPVQVSAVDWPDDPGATLLSDEASRGTTPVDTGTPEAVELWHAPDLSPGQVRIVRDQRGTVIAAADLRAAAGAVLALCNHRFDDLYGQLDIDLGSKVLWAHFAARTLTEADIYALLRSIAALGYRGVIVDTGGWFRSISLRGAHEPGALDSNAWARVAALSRALGLEIVPEVKLLTHQQKLLGLSPRYNSLLVNSRTYDPGSAKLRDLLPAFLEDVLTAFRPSALHIGHDEVARSSIELPTSGSGDRELAPAQYLDSVRWLDELLSARNVSTWMWSDMLLDPQQFPSLPPQELNGWGGFAETARSLPRRVVLLDWHYYSPEGCDAPTRWLRGLGFRVLTAGWWRSDALACQLQALENSPVDQRATGQVVTTWHYVQRRDWTSVKSILTQGAQLYDAILAP